jgi:hypothetical protein
VNFVINAANFKTNTAIHALHAISVVNAGRANRVIANAAHKPRNVVNVDIALVAAAIAGHAKDVIPDTELPTE